MKRQNRKECFFVLRIEGATAMRRRVSFHLVNVRTGEFGKQSDASRFGFFVQPQDALNILKLVGAQVEADNAKLARWEGNLSRCA
jgi:hypothetical protein